MSFRSITQIFRAASLLEQVGPLAYSTLDLSLPCLSGSIRHRHSLFLYRPFVGSNSLGNSLVGAALAPAPFVGGGEEL